MIFKNGILKFSGKPVVCIHNFSTAPIEYIIRDLNNTISDVRSASGTFETSWSLLPGIYRKLAFRAARSEVRKGPGKGRSRFVMVRR